MFKSEFSKQIGILRGNENNYASRIEKTNQEKNALLGITEDTEGKSLDPVVQQKLENEIRALYIVAMTKVNEEPNEGIKQKVYNANPLTLVEDTENIINKFLEEFKFIE